MNPIKVFISYAHKDEDYKNTLRTILKPLERREEIKVWDDSSIIAGGEWDDEIKAALENADVLLFLISFDFVASDYINDVEIKKAMTRYEERKVKIIPIIIRPCDLKESGISRFQGLPKGAKPITTWDNEDEAWLDVNKGLKRLFDSMKKKSNDNANNSQNANTSTNSSTHSNGSNNTTNNNSGSINSMSDFEKQSEKRRLKQMVGKGKIEEVLEFLSGHPQTTVNKQENAVFTIQKKYGDLKSAKLLGTIDFSSASTQQSQVTLAVLGLIDAVFG